MSAAQGVLEEQGFEALTMTEVAARAGVTRRAVYMHFATRAELVSALFDHVAGAAGLEESLRGVREATDAGDALDQWAAHLARYHPRLLAVDRAVERVRHSDPDAAAHRRRVAAEKLATCRLLTRRLEVENRLSEGWTAESAADMLFALISSDMIEALIVDRRWSRQRLAEQLALLLRSTFVADEPDGPPAV